MVRKSISPAIFGVCFLLLCSCPATLRVDAASPCVQFDVVQIADAVDASTPEFLSANPDEKLIRVRLPISSLVRLGSEASLLQYLYVISGGTSAPFQIVDYAPKTTLTTDISGSISIEETTGNSSSIGINALAPHDFPVKADASASHNVKESNSSRLQKLPPKKLVAASGTMHRGLSAYFKLKPSSQTTLEGDKLFEVTARVPFHWRAGLVRVNCSAFSRPQGITPSFDDRDVVCGQNHFVVGVYMSGDEVAKQSVWKLAQTQLQLRKLAQQNSRRIEEERYPSLGHKLGAALSFVKPRIPNQWLDQLLSSNDYYSFERHLPQKVRVAATEYREARKEVLGFAG